MKQLILLAALAAALVMGGCTSALHNGTEMAISQVTISGLPTNPYADGTILVFSYNSGTAWVHDTGHEADFNSARFRATVTGGTATFTFSPSLQITTPQLQFLLIDSTKTWGTFKIDKKHSGKSGGDVLIDNAWTGSSVDHTVTGTVSGDDVTWTMN